MEAEAALEVFARPLFLHCGWRTAGTWIWSRFRDLPQVMGFYEPLHESLATMTLRTMPAMRPGATDSGHPDDERPYFGEFASLLSPKKPGARGYQPEFAYDAFFSESVAGLAQLSVYLRSLVRLAHANGKTPVFKFCRSLGRLWWMRTAFPDAAHVLVVRDPWSQWTSGWRIFANEGNPYFIVMPLRILVRYGEHPLVHGALTALGISLQDCRIPERHAHACAAVMAKSRSLLYRAFLAFWLSTAFAAAPHADAVVESDCLEVFGYRADVERLFEQHAGMTVDLRSAKSLRRTIWFDGSFDPGLCHEDALRGAAALELLQDGCAASSAAVVRKKIIESMSVSHAGDCMMPAARASVKNNTAKS